ncbi:hypothetical protein CTI12_AA559690 [Artemisia annua]|uniref:RING-type domain-containing protein n=1 Tax=Artemisia annua TaxID=35608 RepID=A0A2U1KVM7_ARTAN|nr:hypothetical protein CTI12_AA559690 [Artemisia annua]
MGDLRNVPQENPNQDDDDTFTCEICNESVSLPNKKFVNGNRCVHEFCTACMIKYIRIKLEENFSNIKCPHESCNHSLEPLSCRTKISHKLFNKWCDTLCESKVLGFDGVYCPNKCKVAWHDGYTCEETRDGNNVDFDVVCKNNGWKLNRCPKCKHCIEYLGGSLIIKCRSGRSKGKEKVEEAIWNIDDEINVEEKEIDDDFVNAEWNN